MPTRAKSTTRAWLCARQRGRVHACVALAVATPACIITSPARGGGCRACTQTTLACTVHTSRQRGHKLSSVHTGAGDPPAADPCRCGGCCLEPCIRARGSGGTTVTRAAHHAGQGHSDGQGRVLCYCIPDCTCVYVCMYMWMRACMCVRTCPRMRT